MFEGFYYCHLWKVQFQLIGILQHFFSLDCKLFKSDLQIMNTGYFTLSYIEKSISTGSHFFRYFLLVNKLYELNVFKLQNIFHTFPEA